MLIDMHQLPDQASSEQATMNSLGSRPILPQVGITVFLWFVFLVVNTLNMLAAVLKVEQSSLLLTSFLVGGTLAFWVYRDSRSTGVSMGLDQAFFIIFAWPITFPLYIYISRGFRSGSLLLLIFLGLYVLSLIPAILIVIVIAFSKAILSMG